jgi:hypothetical protein
MLTKFKKLFLSLLILETFFMYVPAYAQNLTPYDYSKSGVQNDIEKYLCTPKNGGSTVLYQCINQLYKFAIVLASVVGVFFIVIAGYIYMSSDGSSEAVDKAKSILTSTITAIVILLAGYVLLNALNPDLIQFHSVNPPAMQTVMVGTTGTTGTTGATGTAVSGSATQIAASILATPNITLMNSHPSGISDPASTAKQNITDVSNGNPAQNSCYTQNGITAPCGKNVSLNTSMLQTLLNIGNQMPITVTEIAGGVHSSNPTDSHYTGRAFDVVPATVSLTTQKQLFDLITAQSGTVIVECDITGQPHIQTTLTATNAATYSTCIGQSGYHIHGQW